MNGVFVSYRRSDSAGWTGRLVATLGKRLTRATIFMDIDTVSPGQDFHAAIERALASSRVVLAVVGPRWLDSSEGRRRLFEADDLVALEIARALTLPGVHVVPVLVGGARLPAARDLPESLAALARRQAFELTDSRWNYDVDRLVQALVAMGVQGRSRNWLQRPYGHAIAGALLSLAAALVWLAQRPTAVPDDNRRPLTAAPASEPASPPAGQGRAVPVQQSLDGLWAGEFARFSDNSRRREVIRLKVEGSAVDGESWQETWHDGANAPRLYRRFSFGRGKLEGDSISFCVPIVWVVGNVDEKFRNCYEGKVQDGSIAFRVTYQVDHPSDVPEYGKFEARRISN
jgi:hypothetical protein